jgi:hypothetical protein
MNLQPMQPSPLDSSGNPFDVFCSRCRARKSSTDVDCDLDAPAGTFYCQTCVIPVHLENFK